MDVDAMFDLLPSLHAVLERDAPARTVAHLALAATHWHERPATEADLYAADAPPATGAAPATADGVPGPIGSERPLMAGPAELPGPAGVAPPPIVAEKPEVVDRRSTAPVTPRPAAASLLARGASFLSFARPRPEAAPERAAKPTALFAAAPSALICRLHLA